MQDDPESQTKPGSSTSPNIIRIDCLAIEDALAVSASPGSLLIELRDVDVLELGNGHPLHAHARVLAAGPVDLVNKHPLAEKAKVISRPQDVIIPGLVNAHTHFDLTHIGPHPFDPDRGFMGFVDLVRSHRHSDEEKIAESVRLGIESSLRAGVVAVGDIAGSAGGWPRLAAFDELIRSPLWGVSYLEFFATGNAESQGLARLEETLEEGVRRVKGSRMKLGLSPHAPNTVSRKAYMKAIELAKRFDLPLTTHLSETVEERDFIAAATGPQRDLLETLGIWNESILREVGHGRTPVEHLEPILNYGDFSAVHLNSLSDRDIRIILDSKTSSVYCPRASMYFNAEEHFGPHRYRDLLFCGLKVALGTDSIINLWREGMNPSVDPSQMSLAAPTLSILDEMRLLYRRDGVTAMGVLGMATMDGAFVLGLDPLSFTFKRNAQLAGIVAISAQRPGISKLDLAFDRILLGNASPELLLVGK